MDVTPIVPVGRQVIDGYGEGRFRISGTVYDGAMLVSPTRSRAWGITSFAEIEAAPLLDFLGGLSVRTLLLGCGPAMRDVPPTVRKLLRDHEIVIEAMDTGAACRTYNVLLSEERAVAAALLPI